jgi:hypothetical protein
LIVNIEQFVYSFPVDASSLSFNLPLLNLFM